MAFYQIEPWGQDRIEYMLGHLMALFVSANKDGKKNPGPVRIEEFMLPPYNKRQTGKRQTQEEMKAKMNMLASMQNARVAKDKAKQ